MSAGQGDRTTIVATATSSAEVRVMGPAVISISGEFGSTGTGTATVQFRDPENNLVSILSTVIDDTNTDNTFFLNFPVKSRNSLSVALVGGSGTVALVIVTQGDILGD
jgi:hypothetical protein